MKAIHDFLLHKNEYTGLWDAAHRDNQHELFNGGPNKVSSSRPEVLEELINLVDGDISKLNELIHQMEIETNLNKVEKEYDELQKG